MQSMDHFDSSTNFDFPLDLHSLDPIRAFHIIQSSLPGRWLALQSIY